MAMVEARDMMEECMFKERVAVSAEVSETGSEAKQRN